MLIHTYHAVPLPRTCGGLERSLSERHIRGMAGERHGKGMTCVNQTRPHCVNRMRKTQSEPLAKRHGTGTAWYMGIRLCCVLSTDPVKCLQVWAVCLRTVSLFTPFAICTNSSVLTVPTYYLLNSISLVLYRSGEVVWKVDHNHELNKICNAINVDK
jgi:hypothetical protein